MRVFLVCLVLLAGCAPRDRADVRAVPVPLATVVPILTATTRAMPVIGGAILPGTTRSAPLGFGRYDVAIPPAHQPGTLRRSGTAEAFDPERHFSLTDATQLSADQFRADLGRALSRLGTSGEVLLFVHGYNTTFIEGVYRQAQLHHDLSLPGVPVHYSWPSAGAPLAYAHDRDSALFARDGLESLLMQIVQAGGRRILLVGHSMGAHLVMETLRQMAIADSPAMGRLSGVVLISPDLDIELFHAQATRIGALPQPFIIVTSRRDNVLRLSARLTGQQDRLGTLADATPLADLGVTLFDISAFSTGASGHFTVANSPALLALLNRIGDVDTALQLGEQGRLPLLPATVLTIQNATQVILQPASMRPPR